MLGMRASRPKVTAIMAKPLRFCYLFAAKFIHGEGGDSITGRGDRGDI